MKAVKVILKIVLILILILALAAGGYVGYLMLQYSRIADYTPLTIENPTEQRLQLGQQYTAVTYNIGFGAYDTEYSFFMDSGTMADGTKVTGKSSRAASEQAARANTAGAISALQSMNSDFILLQEVDKEADRSHGVNQVRDTLAAFPEHSSIYASNFHTAYLFWPVTNPIGKIEGGLLTLSRYDSHDAIRRSYPVDESFPTKFFDLDRCFTVQWLPVEGTDKELVLINTHMSAYDEGGLVREQQIKVLFEMMEAERDKGNYVIVGGDYNHVLDIALDTFPSGQQIPDWVSTLSQGEMPAGFSIVNAANNTEVATCRAAEIPYTPGVNYTTVIDGFLVSDNVSAAAYNIDLGFAYSDHNPVQLTFQLLGTSDDAPEEGGEEDAQAADGEPAGDETEEPIG